MRRYLHISNKQKKLLLVGGDTLIIFAAFFMAYFFRIVIYEAGNVSEFSNRLSWLLPLGVLLHILVFYIFELYDVESRKPDAKLFLWLMISVILATSLIVMASYIFPKHKMGRVLVSVHVPVVVTSIFLWRKFFYLLKSQDLFNKRLLWIDFGDLKFTFSSEFQKNLSYEYNYIGMISDYKDNPGDILLNDGSYFPNLEKLIIDKNIDTIVLSENPKIAPKLKSKLIDFKFQGIEILDFPTLYQKLFRKIPILNIKGSFFLFSHQDKSFQPFIYLRAKRIFDLALSTMCLVLAAPLFLLTIIAIKFSTKGSVFYRQERLGLNERPFTLLKFRTMVRDAEKKSGPKWSSEDDPRITKVGKFLRKTRIDEIPQLINVLKGEMSFVGPRPIRKYFATQLANRFPFYRLRFTVKPGLTGWAQVKGDYAGSIEGQFQKLEYELFYIQNRSMFMDLFIILKTIQTVIFRPGE